MMTPADSATLLVPTPEYETIQSAIDAASHGDEVLITDSATYAEQVTIVPHGVEYANAFHITLRGANSNDPPRVKFEDTERRDLYNAVIRIENIMQSRDMRVTIQNLEIVGKGDYTNAVSIKDGENDTDHEYNTGLFLYDNFIYSEPDLHQYASIYLGTRYPDTPTPRRYDLTSLKWGEIRNNTIIAGGLDMDAISAWHFSGVIANNVVTSTQEGCHLSFARIESGTKPDFIPSEYASTTIKHNSFVCNNQNALHFTHGSAGEICNNLFMGSWRDDADPRDSSIGLHVGPGCVTDCENCPPDSSECYDEDLSDDLGKTVAVAHNNVCDKNQGPGILIHNDATQVTLFGNIVTRSCSIFNSSQCGGIQSRDRTTVPSGYSSQNNLLWKNEHLIEPGFTDYLPSGMVGTNDKNHSTGNNHPYFEGVIGSPPTGYSYMLQHDEDYEGYDECYEESEENKSEAIDQGPTGETFHDKQPPGLGNPQNDAGAYGGPDAEWGGAAEPCLEYVNLPPFTICE